MPVIVAVTALAALTSGLALVAWASAVTRGQARPGELPAVVLAVLAGPQSRGRLRLIIRHREARAAQAARRPRPSPEAASRRLHPAAPGVQRRLLYTDTSGHKYTWPDDFTSAAALASLSMRDIGAALERVSRHPGWISGSVPREFEVRGGRGRFLPDPHETFDDLLDL